MLIVIKHSNRVDFELMSPINRDTSSTLDTGLLAIAIVQFLF